MRAIIRSGAPDTSDRLHHHDSRSSETGATAIEYGLVATMIAVVIVAAVTILGTNLGDLFDQVAGAFEGHSSNCIPGTEWSTEDQIICIEASN